MTGTGLLLHSQRQIQRDREEGREKGQREREGGRHRRVTKQHIDNIKTKDSYIVA